LGRREIGEGMHRYPGKFRVRAASLIVALVSLLLCGSVAWAQTPAFRALAFYSTNVEPDHVRTGNEALAFFRDLAAKDNFVFDTTTDWDKLNDNDLKSYQVILWINDFPHTAGQRTAFEKYMEHGGGWLGLACRHPFRHWMVRIINRHFRPLHRPIV